MNFKAFGELFWILVPLILIARAIIELSGWFLYLMLCLLSFTFLFFLYIIGVNA